MDWFLIIRDDGSTDDTVKIIKRFISERDDCHYIEDDLRLGVVQSFGKLLQYAKKTNFNYFMFADQDDVWLEYKVEETLKTMKTRECVDNATSPVLVHTDLVVADKYLKTISQSFSNYQSIPKRSLSFKELVISNNVTGCTVMINRSLACLVGQIPLGVIMHDYWIALIAAKFGDIVFKEQTTILYRQHDRNDTGAKKSSLWFLLSKIFSLKEVKKQIIKKIIQYNLFCKEFSNFQSGLLLFPLEGGFWRKRKFLIQYGFLRGKFYQNIALLLLI